MENLNQIIDMWNTFKTIKNDDIRCIEIELKQFQGWVTTHGLGSQHNVEILSKMVWTLKASFKKLQQYVGDKLDMSATASEFNTYRKQCRMQIVEFNKLHKAVENYIDEQLELID